MRMTANLNAEILLKCPTGIRGLDELTLGGLPSGRTSLICGGPGCGKTVASMEFLVRGALNYQEPGVFLSFEENTDELIQNFAAMGFDLKRLMAEKKLSMDHIHIEKSEIEETGEFDLEGLFVRLEHAIDSIGAKRVVLDTIEMLFAGFSNPVFLRSEIRRLFRWMKDKGVTAIVTGEKGEGLLTRYGLEEYIADCVIILDHRIDQQISTRRLRVVKYRGSQHGTNEYPFIISGTGVSVLPVTSAGLTHAAITERVPTGLLALDDMLEGGGFYRGSSILISGTAGTGKSTLAIHAVDAACRRGERCVVFSFEESPDQLVRNMLSSGIDLRDHVKSGKLKIFSSRPSVHGLELHLVTIHHQIQDAAPHLVVVDPISDFTAAGTVQEIKSMLTRLIDSIKNCGITAIFTTLTNTSDATDATEQRVSSLMDSWILLRDIETDGECHRGLRILKSRGMGHSHEIREFFTSSQGIKIQPKKIRLPPGDSLSHIHGSL
jgi:circadian clock protein KaiC